MTEAVHATWDGSPGSHCKPNETFICPTCQRVCCYCYGCADEYPDLCDDCAAKQTDDLAHD